MLPPQIWSGDSEQSSGNRGRPLGWGSSRDHAAWKPRWAWPGCWQPCSHQLGSSKDLDHDQLRALSDSHSWLVAGYWQLGSGQGPPDRIPVSFSLCPWVPLSPLEAAPGTSPKGAFPTCKLLTTSVLLCLSRPTLSCPSQSWTLNLSLIQRQVS